MVNIKAKPRVGVMIKQTARVQRSSLTIQRVDKLKVEFRDMCKQLKKLQKALRDRHTAMMETLQARAAVSALRT